MARWLTPNTQILILLFGGVVVGVMEAMYSNMKSSLTEAWQLDFPEDLYSPGFENILKTIIFAIILVRGATLHIYLASYLLLLIPVIKERMRVVIIIWLAISGFRSIIVNLVATVLGIFICISLPHAHPACFNFIGAKGFELACSAFMWVLVNDFMHYLGRGSLRASQIRRAIEEQINQPKASLGHQSIESWHFDDLTKNTLEDNDEDDDEDDDSSSDDLYKTVSDAVRSIKKRERQESLIVEDNSTKAARAAVIKFFENSFGLKFVGADPFNEEDELTAEFLNHHKEDIENLILNLRNYVKSNSSKGKCVHKNCYHCMKKNTRRRSPQTETPSYQFFPRSNLEFPQNTEHSPPKEFVVKFNEFKSEDDNSARAPYIGMGETTESLLSILQNLEKSPSNISLNTSKLDLYSKSSSNAEPRNTEIQTEPLSKGILKKIESQENKFLNKM